MIEWTEVYHEFYVFTLGKQLREIGITKISTVESKVRPANY